MGSDYQHRYSQQQPGSQVEMQDYQGGSRQKDKHGHSTDGAAQGVWWLLGIEQDQDASDCPPSVQGVYGKQIVKRVYCREECGQGYVPEKEQKE